MQPKRLLLVLTTGLVACGGDRSMTQPPLRPAAAAVSNSPFVYVKDSVRIEIRSVGNGAKIDVYVHGAKVSDIEAKDHKNGVIHQYRAGSTSTWTLVNGVPKLDLGIGTSGTVACTPGIHTMEDFDGDGIDDITGEAISGPCSAEKQRLDYLYAKQLAASLTTAGACLGSIAAPAAGLGCAGGVIAVYTFWEEIEDATNAYRACLDAQKKT